MMNVKELIAECKKIKGWVVLRENGAIRVRRPSSDHQAYTVSCCPLTAPLGWPDFTWRKVYPRLGLSQSMATMLTMAADNNFVFDKKIVALRKVLLRELVVGSTAG
jgi:hypothetical protein